MAKQSGKWYFVPIQGFAGFYSHLALDSLVVTEANAFICRRPFGGQNVIAGRNMADASARIMTLAVTMRRASWLQNSDIAPNVQQTI